MTLHFKTSVFLFTCIILMVPSVSKTQGYSNEQIRNYIQSWKDYNRGPYKDIKWFCDDNTIREARDPCPEPLKGKQHARYAPEVEELAAKNHLFFGQILTYTDKDDFWDEPNDHSRLKQYQIEQFLFNADNGWIHQQSQFYRGAKQIEDEKEWGQAFLEKISRSNKAFSEEYLLLRLAARDIPHGEDTDETQRIRAYSKYLGDDYNPFFDLRIKLHNNPEKSDLTKVINFKEKHYTKLNQSQKDWLDKLITDMKAYYQNFDVQQISSYARFMPKESQLFKLLNESTTSLTDVSPKLRAMALSELIYSLRENWKDTQWDVARIKLLDLTVEIEKQLIRDLAEWETTTLSELRDKICYTTKALAGAGYIESWEYDLLVNDINWLYGTAVSRSDLMFYRKSAQKTIQWGSQRLTAIYMTDVNNYIEFEPLTKGFLDDKIRSTLLLSYGNTLAELNELIITNLDYKAEVLGINKPGLISGLNPGYAKGKLIVKSEVKEDEHLNSNYIYAFNRPPADLSPVAGILSVEAGNPVSHVQLLARNLAIPNAVIGADLLEKLEKYDGKEIFYAVSEDGYARLKLASDMSTDENKLFEDKQKNRKKLKISTERLVFNPDSLLDMSKIGSEVSGVWCGPKAANLGQLKKLYPTMVVEGIVIPFGIFKDHLEQDIPSIGETYWTFLHRIFTEKEAMESQGIDQSEIDCIVLQELALFRDLILEIPLKDSFVKTLTGSFTDILGKPMGDVPVFLRSDTNMEDLPEFTGAGLNLTLFNVLQKEKILNGIKKIWASPFQERSYRWRQSYLANPEDVYPSILIIPSVNVDKSGVIITDAYQENGISTVSFSRGVGGAVDGQSAETYRLYANGYNELTFPAREGLYRTIPPSGGSIIETANFLEPVLSSAELNQLKTLISSVKEKMLANLNEKGPWDIELGFKDGEIWLFQIRPFVENKSALQSEYLKTLNPDLGNEPVAID